MKISPEPSVLIAHCYGNADMAWLVQAAKGVLGETARPDCPKGATGRIWELLNDPYVAWVSKNPLHSRCIHIFKIDIHTTP